MVSKDHKLSVRRQCALLTLVRSNLFYEPKGESAHNLRFMGIIDKQFLEMPWYGSRQMARYMMRQGHACGLERHNRHRHVAAQGPTLGLGLLTKVAGRSMFGTLETHAGTDGFRIAPNHMKQDAVIEQKLVRLVCISALYFAAVLWERHRPPGNEWTCHGFVPVF